MNKYDNSLKSTEETKCKYIYTCVFILTSYFDRTILILLFFKKMLQVKINIYPYQVPKTNCTHFLIVTFMLLAQKSNFTVTEIQP